MIEQIKFFLEEKKAENVELIDVSGSDYFTDCVIVATMISVKQTLALAEELQAKAKELGASLLGSEISEDWVVLDFGDFLVHLLSENFRQKYKIEDFLKDFKKNKL